MDHTDDKTGAAREIWTPARGSKPADPAPEGFVSLIAARQRNGTVYTDRMIDDLLWLQSGGPHDFVEWRVVGQVEQLSPKGE